MGEAGLVESIHLKTATVVFDCKSACEKCSVCMKHDNKMTIVADNEIGAKPGDIVQVNMERQVYFSAVLLMYVLPLICLVAALLLSGYLGASELLQAITALSSATTVFIVLRLTDKRRQQNDKYIPKIVAVVTGTNQDL